jgi:diguanylate cyclase (GGDEF)-like protein
VSVEYASDGQAGLEMARQMRPDLILLDIEMPGMDGFEVCRRLKLDTHTLSIPIVFLTGATGSAHKILALELGAVDYVSKPFDAAELRARVRSALRLKRLSELLSSKARVDPVTGLWNEMYFDARLAAEVSVADRTGLALSVVICNIDGFKKMNAEHGVWFGDEILCSMANVLAETARREDVVCRVDGAGLAIVCPGTNVGGAEALVRRVQSGLARLRFACHGSEIQISASYGIAGTEMRRSEGETVITPEARASQLRTAAAKAVEVARQRGADRVAVAGPEDFGGEGGSGGAGVTGPAGGEQIRERRRAAALARPGTETGFSGSLQEPSIHSTTKAA